jgi:hypothetical protein
MASFQVVSGSVPVAAINTRTDIEWQDLKQKSAISTVIRVSGWFLSSTSHAHSIFNGTVGRPAEHRRHDSRVAHLFINGGPSVLSETLGIGYREVTSE